MSTLALLGGKKQISHEHSEIFHWPIVNPAMEAGVLQVLRDGNMSGTDITRKFEQAYAGWTGAKYALAHSSGTASLQCAMYGVDLGSGDEIICPSITY
jgi:dTDP-4-amino-4,6-dideoxygalactose transaminase